MAHTPGTRPRLSPSDASSVLGWVNVSAAVLKRFYGAKQPENAGDGIGCFRWLKYQFVARDDLLGLRLGNPSIAFQGIPPGVLVGQSVEMKRH